MVRPAVETGVGAAGREAAAGKVAGVKQSRNARNVGLISRRLQIELQLDVLVEGIGDAGRHHDAFVVLHGACSLGGHRQTPLDLAHTVDVVIYAPPIARREASLETGQLPGDRIQNAAILLAALGTLLGSLGLNITKQAL